MPIETVVTVGVQLADLQAIDAALARYVAANVGGTWPPTCSRWMCAADDPHAVTDGSGRVYGTEGLRICEASQMPLSPCANTNVPTIMIAGKIGDAIRREQRNGE